MYHALRKKGLSKKEAYRQAKEHFNSKFKKGRRR